MSLSLPVDSQLDGLIDAVRQHRVAVLQAPPGTGKTTRVPPALARAFPGRVVVLEPRRVAARASARRVAAEWGCAVGEEIGYQVRNDRRVSARTRVVFVTEGVFLRQVTADPFLEGVSVVVLDEFHERSVDADLSIALCRSIQKELREDLVIVAMSATLQAGPVAAFLAAPILTATAPLHPLDTRYDPRPDSRRLERRVADAVRALPAQHDVLVFLPGMSEIRRAATLIERDTVILHGRLDAREQDAVLRPSATPRVILSTNVAESSVTVPGVRAVVDTGVARVARLDRQTGLNRLEVLPIACDSADQRAGRAAREGPGIVHRLWTARAHRDRPLHSTPSIHRSDLAPALLRLMVFGEPDPRSFEWFEPPEPKAVDDAMELLRLLGAVQGGRLTQIGTRLAEAPLHPRLARFVHEAERLGSGRRAARVAVLLSDGGRPEGELTEVVAPASRDADRLARTTGTDPEALERAALAGWPDRLAKQRGEGAVMTGDTGLLGGRHPLFVALALHPSKRGERGEWWVTLQSPVEETWLERTSRVVCTFDGQRVSAFREECAGTLVLARHRAKVDPKEGAAVLFEALKASMDSVIPDDRDLQELLGRLQFVAEARPHPDLPDGCPTSLEPVLRTLCRKRTTVDAVRKANWRGALLESLDYRARRHLDEVAPERLQLASGQAAKLTYRDRGSPVLAVRIQRLFGTMTTPRVGGRPVLVHLLAPNGRPQQVTSDLTNFWATTYFEVRKELRRRYPKHAWPDDPSVPVKRRR